MKFACLIACSLLEDILGELDMHRAGQPKEVKYLRLTNPLELRRSTKDR